MCAGRSKCAPGAAKPRHGILPRRAGATARHPAMISRYAGVFARCAEMIARYRAAIARCAGGSPWHAIRARVASAMPRAVRWSHSAMPWNHSRAPLKDRSIPRSHPRKPSWSPLPCPRLVPVRYLIAVEPWKSLGKFLCDCRVEKERPAECKINCKLFSWLANRVHRWNNPCRETPIS